MNKAFKVLWNQVRGTYVVASEAQVTHGKPNKATKTIVAAAVAGLMAVAGAASATTITNESFGSGENQYDTTKFISGNGQELVIQTDGDARELAYAIKSGDFDRIREALGTGNGKVTLVGLAGGQNYLDSSSWNSLSLVRLGLILSGQTELDADIQKLQDQFFELENTSASGETIINIGGLTSEEKLTNPLLIATVAGDRLINASLNADPAAKQEVNRIDSGTTVIAESGNILGLVGGSSAINLGGVSLSVGSSTLPLQGAETQTTIQGNTGIHLNGLTSSAGVFGAGSAIAITGIASSTVTGDTNITIDTQASSDGYEGLHAGVIGGGLSVATMGGESTSTVGGTTTINLNNGAILGVLGGGVAASAEVSSIVESVLPTLNTKLEEFGGELSFDDSLNKGGIASSVSGNVNIQVGKDSSVLGIIGGGLAASQQMWDSTSASNANTQVGNVQIDIGDSNAEPMFADNDEKLAYHREISAVLGKVSGYLSDQESISEFELLADIVDIAKPGLTIGVLGGGMALGYQANNGSPIDGIKTTAQATSSTENVTINVHSGYNIGIFGSGLAASSAASVGETTQNAVSTVKNVAITLDGGDTVGVMGGGLTYFTGTKEPNTGISALSTTDEVTIHVLGEAYVDGLVGGGLAIDDSNPYDGAEQGYIATKNASTTVDKANIVVDSGNIGFIHFEFFGSQQQTSDPGLKAYWNSLTYVMHEEEAAITGGGLAAGGQGADSEETGISHVGTVNIALNGDKTQIEGNVFGGGIATDGGWSSVGTSNISVDGATVTGSIYGGGLALEGIYERDGVPDTYNNQSKTTVGTVNIALTSGKVEGNVYAGGKVASDSGNDVAHSTVDKANVSILSDQVLGEESLVDGSGAGKASLSLANQNGLFNFAKTQKVSAFDTITAAGAVTNFSYDFGNKTATTLTGGPVDFVALTGTEGKTLALGTDEASGIASIDEGINLNGLTLDVNNGLLSFNADGATAMEIAATAPTQTKAMAYVSGNLDLTNAKVLVGDIESDVNGLYLGKDGTLIADAAAKSSVTGTADTADGTIHFVGVAQDDAQVTIAAAEETNTTVDNVLYKAVQTDNVYTFEARSGEELNEVGLGDFDDSAFLADLVHHDNKGARYIEGFLDQSNGSVTNANRSQQLNAAMNLATAAGVQTAAIDSATVGLDAANKRASIIHDPVEGGVLFAEASGRRTEMGGSADFGEIKSELGGVVVGGEYTTGDWTFGALANVGTGSVKGQGNNAGVNNDVDYYGAQIYTGKRFGQFNVVGQVGYLSTNNDITHSTLGINKADVDADVITVGVRGEMRFDLTANTRIVPYIGLNYLRVGTDGYTTSQGVQVSDVDQNLFTLPVGVKYAGDMKTQSGWAWTPSVDLAYVAAFGDRDVDATTHVGAVGQTTMDVWAESTVRTTIGVKAQKDNFGFGVEAGGAFGSDDTKGLFGQVRVDYRF